MVMVYKITKGNTFVLHILLEKKMVEKDVSNTVRVDLQGVTNLQVELIDGKCRCCSHTKMAYNIGTENDIVVRVPSDLECCVYGFRIRGTEGGAAFSSVDPAVFCIVPTNGMTRVLAGVTDGDDSDVIHCKYWIETGFVGTDKSYYGASGSEVSLAELYLVAGSIRMRRVTINTTSSKEYAWFVSYEKIAVSQGGLPLGMTEYEKDGLYYYRTDALQLGKHEFTIMEV